MDNANRAGRMMLSARVNPAYIARKAGFCPGANGDIPVCAKKKILLMDDVAIFEWEKRAPMRAERGGYDVWRVCGCIDDEQRPTGITKNNQLHTTAKNKFGHVYIIYMTDSPSCKR